MDTAVTNATTATNAVPAAHMSGTVKLDGIPKLTGADNYDVWSQHVRFALRAMGIKQYVVDGTPAYDHPTATNHRAQADLVLLQVLSPSIITQICEIESPQKIWTYLRDTYQRSSSTSLVSGVQKLSEVVASRDTKNPQAFITRFELEWTKLLTICLQTTTEDYRLTMRTLMQNDTYKKVTLLAAFEKTHPLVVDNLKTKDNLSYSATKDWLLNLTEQHQAPRQVASSSAAPAAESTSDLSCTWCKKFFPTMVNGHHYRSCSRLKEHKKTQQPIAAPATVALPTSSSSSSLPQTASVTINHHVSSSPSKWLFDTGATSHMTSNTNLFSELRPDYGNVSLADHSVIPYTGIGTVHLLSKVGEKK